MRNFLIVIFLLISFVLQAQKPLSEILRDYESKIKHQQELINSQSREIARQSGIIKQLRKEIKILNRELIRKDSTILILRNRDGIDKETIQKIRSENEAFRIEILNNGVAMEQLRSDSISLSNKYRESIQIQERLLSEVIVLKNGQVLPRELPLGPFNYSKEAPDYSIIENDDVLFLFSRLSHVEVSDRIILKIEVNGGRNKSESIRNQIEKQFETACPNCKLDVKYTNASLSQFSIKISTLRP